MRDKRHQELIVVLTASIFLAFKNQRCVSTSTSPSLLYQGGVDPDSLQWFTPMIQDHCAGTDSSATGTLTPQQIQITQVKDNCCKHYGCCGSDTLTPYSGAIFPTIIHKLPLQQSRKLQMTYLVHPKKLFLMFLIILISLAYIHESLKELIHAVFVSLPIASRESVSSSRFVHYISFYHLKT